MFQLTLKDQLKLSLLQNLELEDLKSAKRESYRKLLRQRVWQKIWDEGAKAS